MTFRRKLTILLLLVSLVPLLINSVLHQTTIRQISQKLTTDTRDLLEDNTTQQLLAIVNNQSLLLKRDREFIFQAIAAQAREVENLLAIQKKPTNAQLAGAYLAIQHSNPNLFLWQATYLKSGQNLIFPRKSLPTDKNAAWYKKIIRAKEAGWQLDLVGSKLQISVYVPVHSRQGKIVGITAFALDYKQFFNDWQLPQLWQEQGRLFVLSVDPDSEDPARRLNIVLKIVNRKAQYKAASRPEKTFLSLAPAASINALINAVKQRETGTLTLEFDNKKTIWIYAGATPGEPFPLLLIPQEQVSLPADSAADYVEEQFASELKFTAILSLGVLLAVIIIAIRRARAVTKPLSKLVNAAEKLSQGDFSVQVEIQSRDEFEELGETFNRIGPQLKERQEIKQSLAVAKDIQQLILPVETPKLEKFDIASRLDYCDETGGDYYDYIEMNSGRWGLAVGDVVGHGVGAALLMASAAGILHAAIANGEEDLETLFSSLNVFLEKDVGDIRFMTLFFTIIDPETQSLQWLSAGHGPMFLYRAETGDVTELTATTMPLGVMSDVEFKPIQHETLAAGDILAVGTDGIWEATNPSGELFGAERVGQLLKDFAAYSAEEIIDNILLQVEAFQEEIPQDDDITLVVLKAC